MIKRDLIPALNVNWLYEYTSVENLKGVLVLVCTREN